MRWGVKKQLVIFVNSLLFNVICQDVGLTEVFLLLQQDSLAILIRAYGQQGWQCDGGTGGRFQKQLGVKNNNVPALPNTSSSPSVAQKVKEGRKEVENSQEGRRKSSASCQRATSCLWCSSEPIPSWLLPPRIVCSEPEEAQGHFLIRKLLLQKKQQFQVQQQELKYETDR